MLMYLHSVPSLIDLEILYERKTVDEPLLILRALVRVLSCLVHIFRCTELHGQEADVSLIHSASFVQVPATTQSLKTYIRV